MKPLFTSSVKTKIVEAKYYFFSDYTWTREDIHREVYGTWQEVGGDIYWNFSLDSSSARAAEVHQEAYREYLAMKISRMIVE